MALPHTQRYADRGRSRSLRPILLTVGTAILLLEVIDGAMSPIFAIALVVPATLLLMLRPALGMRWLTPNRAFLVPFSLYYAAAISLAHSPTAWIQSMLVIIGGLAFASGAAIGTRWRTSIKRSGAIPRYKPRLQIRPNAVIATFVLGSAVFALLAIKRGLPIFSTDPNLARTTFFANGYQSEFVIIALHVTLILSGLLVLAGPRHLCLRFAIIGSIALLELLLTDNRGLLFSPLIVLAVWYAWSRRISLRGGIVLGLCALFLFSAFGYVRNLHSYGPSYVDDLNYLGYRGDLHYVAPLALYVAGTSQTFDTTIHTIPSQHAYTLGTEFFGPLLHKKSTDLFLKNLFGYQFQGFGLAVGLLNSFYIDWGFLGIPLGMLVLGLVSGRIYLAASQHEGRWLLLYGFWFANLVLSVYGSPFPYLSTLIEPALAIVLVRSLRLRSEDSALELAQAERLTLLANFA